ncbi:MAG: hypothetical protein ACREU7_01465 [Burkholderiales bacterium]
MKAARLISTEDLIVVSADGRLDLPASEAALEALLTRLEREPGRAVILDLRSADCELTLGEVYGLVNFLANHSSKKTLYRRVAILITSGAHQGKAGFFALCAENRGLEARAFSTVEDVDKWLGSDASGLLTGG